MRQQFTYSFEARRPGARRRTVCRRSGTALLPTANRPHRVSRTRRSSGGWVPPVSAVTPDETPPAAAAAMVVVRTRRRASQG